MKLVIGIPVRNSLKWVRQTIYSVLKYTTVEYEILIVDDDSDKDMKKYLSDISKQHSHVRVIYNNARKGFPYNCNVIFSRTNSDYICILNSDTFVTPNWEIKMIAALESNSKFGMVGPTTSFAHTAQKRKDVFAKKMQMNEEDIVNYAQQMENKFGNGTLSLEVINGFCMFFKDEVFKKVGWFDERFGLGSAEELDYCYRMKKAGYLSAWVQGVYVHHFGHQSFKAEGDTSALWARNHALYTHKVKNTNIKELVSPEIIKNNIRK